MLSEEKVADSIKCLIETFEVVVEGALRDTCPGNHPGNREGDNSAIEENLLDCNEQVGPGALSLLMRGGWHRWIVAQE